MSKWKVEDKDNRGKVLIKRRENGSTSIPLPITIIRKATKVGNTALTLRGYRQKKPDFLFRFLRWFAITDEFAKSPALVNALDGKKIKITIEVLEE